MIKVTSYITKGDVIAVHYTEEKIEYITLDKAKEFFTKKESSFGTTNCHTQRSKQLFKEFIEECREEIQKEHY